MRKIQENKKILFHISTLSGGGAARVMVNLANFFAKNSYEVILATNSQAASLYPLAAEIKLVHIDDEKTRGRISKNFFRIRRLRKLIKAEKPLFTLTFMTENAIRVILASLFLKNKTYASIRSAPANECGTGFKSFIIKMIYCLSDGIVCQTPDVLSWLPRGLRKKSAVIPNQLDEEYFFEKEKRERINVVTAGRFEPAKNHEMLIKAFSEIASQTNDNLLIYGDGALRCHYENLIRELSLEKRVFLPGITKDMLSVYDSCRLFVLSSDYEGMPNVLLEAMARGCACISTNCPCGGPKMLSDNGKCCVLIDTNDKDALSAQMLALLTNDDLRNEYAKKAKEEAKKYNSDIIFKQWENFLLKGN